uniref:Uncharacterized protein n=1 Tax=Guillardia theta TaxID=55529 RepID=A0A7S4UUT6_GUITH|mmetsp:Transcript_9445/g.31581  ORF Transcript_9445/g.31581 Transcript_9445/m.31581 type:complete len:121 (+) Transcript_9445:423-785(+)
MSLCSESVAKLLPCTVVSMNLLIPSKCVDARENVESVRSDGSRGQKDMSMRDGAIEKFPYQLFMSSIQFRTFMASHFDLQTQPSCSPAPSAGSYSPPRDSILAFLGLSPSSFLLPLDSSS